MSNQNISMVNLNSFNLENSHILPPPLFIHSSFRTSSTWLWSKIRKLPNILAYYEIFHESLVNADAKSLNSNNHSSWSSGHPAQAPYFLEFLPLLKKGGGIELFDSSMTFERFIPNDGINGELSLQEISYIKLLIEQGYKNRKIPVLSETRSLGRMPSIKRAMSVNNVLVYRNIFDQWASYSGQSLKGNDYFVSTILETVDKSRDKDQFINCLREFFLNAQPSTKNEDLFLLFTIMHIYLYAKCVDHADLVIDTTAIANDSELRKIVESKLSKMVFASVDLSDVENKFDASIISINDKMGFIDTVNQFTKIIISNCDSQISADFAIKIRDDFISAWSYHDRVTRNSFYWYNKEAIDLKIHAEQKSLEYAHVVSERDQLNVELAQT
ncbi:hypothetical protein, partial [Sphingobium sp. TCM1]|uniref:hypothetical protein n=1 Tax=Sphingobium sp. TCM1 TaxID=453246 RepID=UPI000AE1BD55